MKFNLAALAVLATVLAAAPDNRFGRCHDHGQRLCFGITHV